MFQFASSKNAPVVAELVTGEDRVTSTSVSVVLRIAGVEVTAVESPIIYRFADPARGELRRPVAGIPRITLLMEQEIAVRAGEHAVRPAGPRVRTLGGVGAGDGGRDGLALPPGLRTDSARRTVVLPPFGSTSLFFRVTGEADAGPQTHLRPRRAPSGRTYSRGFVPVEYRHIRPQRFYRVATTAVEAVDVEIPDNAQRRRTSKAWATTSSRCSAQLGIPTTVIDPALLPLLDFTKFTTLVIGPRAYAANEALARQRAIRAGLRAQGRHGRRAVRSDGDDAAGRHAVSDHALAARGPRDRRNGAGARARSEIDAVSARRTRSARRTSSDGCRSAGCTCRAPSIRTIERCFRRTTQTNRPTTRAFS